MRFSKVLAGLTAGALAASAIAVSAFAADPVTVELDSEYKGDWQQAGVIAKENFDKFDGDIKVVLTVEATNVGDGKSYLLKPMEGDKGWDAVTSSLTTSKEYAKPDGFIAIHYDQTEVELVVPSAMAKDMWGGGLSFQVSNVIIKSAVLSDGEAEEAFAVVSEADTNAFCAASVNAPAEEETKPEETEPEESKEPEESEKPEETEPEESEKPEEPKEPEEQTPAETTAAAAAGDTDKPTDDKGNADTGIEGAAVIAGLAVLAAGAVAIAKKRK